MAVGGLGGPSLGTSAKGRQEPQERVTVRRQGLAPRSRSNHRHPGSPAEHATPVRAESSEWLRLASLPSGSAWQLPPSSCSPVSPDRRTQTTIRDLITCSPACLINLVMPGLKGLAKAVCTRSPCQCLPCCPREKQADHPRHWIAVAEPRRPRQTAGAFCSPPRIPSIVSLFLVWPSRRHATSPPRA